MCLEHSCAGTHELATFASEVARRTHPGQATAWLRKLQRSDEGALAGRLACTVTIEDVQAVAGMVKEFAEVVSGKAMLAVVLVKLLTQGLQAGRVDVGQEAAEGGAVGQLVAPKERHKRGGEGAQAVEEGFEGGLSAERIPEQDSDKVDDVILASATTGQVDLLRNGRKDAAPSQIPTASETAEKVPMTNRRQGCGKPLMPRSGLFPPTPAQDYALICPFVPLSAKSWRTFPVFAVVQVAGAPCA